MNFDAKDVILNVREDILKMIYCSQSGHVGGSLSIVEMLAAIYTVADVDPAHPEWEDRDRIILSKGHACPAQYAILAELGYFDKDELWGLRQIDSMLQGHPDMHKTPGIDASTGSLGLGISVSTGMALAAKLKGKGRVFTIIGDGEAQEGLVWEAVMAAGKFHLEQLTVLMDHNGLQIDGTNDEVMPLGDIQKRFELSGWETFIADGHEYNILCELLKKPLNNKPRFILCETVKGKGVSFMEGQVQWHGKTYDEKLLNQAIQEVRSTYGK